MSAPARFRCPSASLTLKVLLNRTQRTLSIAVGLAMAVHMALTQLRGLTEEHQIPKPLTTQFVKRQPRLTKPLELKKRPRPKQRAVRREMVTVRAKAQRDRPSARLQPTTVLRGLSKPHAGIERLRALSGARMEPAAVSAIVEGTREAEQRMDTALELVDIQALDTGQYQAMVVQEPDDKRSLRGFFHIIVIYSASIRDGSLRMAAGVTRQYGGVDAMQVEIRSLVEAVNRFTAIRMDIAGLRAMDSPELLKTPWVMVETLTSFDVTPSEAQNLGYYMTHGGFVFSENDYFALGNPADTSLRAMLAASLATVGLVHNSDWTFEKIPNEHPVYHCYFDFDGPPPGLDHLYGDTVTPGGPVLRLDYLEGITLNGQLVAIHSNKDISDYWPGVSQAKHNTRQLQFGVNMIVYALTREGSVTKQVMDALK